MRLKTICFSVILLGYSLNVFGQNNRLNTYETIGWYNLFATFKLTDKVGLHTEYQWRRDNFITAWQQSLVRVGVNYQLNPKVLFRAGYGKGSIAIERKGNKR